MENLFEILVQRSTLARVENGIVGEVRRRVGLVRGDETNEFLLRHRLQRIVHLRCTPIVETLSEERFFPHSEPEPCAG